MKSNCHFFSLIFLLFPLFGFAQEKKVDPEATLRVFSSPPNAIIRLDTFKVKHATELKLDTGSYRIKFWAPTREVVTKNIILKEGQIKTLAIKLPYTQEFKSYRRKKRNHLIVKNGLKFIPIVGYAVFSLAVNSKINELRDESRVFESNAELHQNLYQNSFWRDDIEANRILFENNKLRYENTLEAIRNNQLLFQVGTVSSLLVTYFSWKVAKKLKKPTFSESPKLSYLQINPIYSSSNKGFSILYSF